MQTLEDLKYSFRLLRKTPVFSGVMLLVIVMSLSLYLTSYTLGNMLAHEPMPFPNGENYVKMRIIESDTGAGVGFPDFDTYIYNRLRETSDKYIELGIYQQNAHVISDADYPQSYVGVSISTEVIQGLEVNPVLGRTFTPNDSLAGAENVVLLGYPVWQDYYNSNPKIIGETSLIDGIPRTIIGVMPEDFGFPRSGNFWLPLKYGNAILPGEGGAVALIGVLKDGISYLEAESELSELLKREAVRYPEIYTGRLAKVYDYSDSYANPGLAFNLPLYLNFVTLILLLISAVNLSSLLLIRYGSRKHELLIRSSLGANGWQLAKQMLLESFIISVTGLLLSFVVCSYLLKGFGYALLERGLESNYWFEYSMNTRGYIVGCISVLVVWLISCSIVAIRAFRSDPGQVSSTANKGNDDSGFNLTTRLIVGFELTLTCFLLICCGAMIHLLIEVSNVDHGVDPAGLVLASVSLTHTDYDQPQSRTDYLKQFKTAVAGIPSVVDVGATTAIPQRPGRLGRYIVEMTGGVSPNQSSALTTVWIDDSYLRTAEISLIEGRAFDIEDTIDSENVAILSESFASQLWPNDSAIGKQIETTTGDTTATFRIVGVITDILQSSTSSISLPTLYRPISQDTPLGLTLMIRVLPNIEMTQLETALRDAASEINRNVPVSGIRTLLDQVYIELQGTDLINLIFIVFALATLLLASIGIYTVMARAIQSATREIGVRRALGSTNFKVAVKYVKQSINYLLISIGLGGGLACVLVALAAPAIGVPDLQFLPLVALLVTLLVSAVVLTATIIPAQIATAIEPGDALRYE